MKNKYMALLAVTVLIVSTGCRSRCNSCNGGWFANNPTIAPPPTYSLNIPSVAQNQQPYYTPGPGSGVNPRANAPTPAGSSQWRPTGNNGAGTQNQNTGVGNSGNGQTAPTTFVETSGPRNTGQSVLAGNQQPVRTAALPASGASFTNSQNYQTTQTDETRDRSRLPVTDASTVRAPSRTFPTGNVGSAVYPTGYSTPVGVQQTYAGQAGFYRQTTPAYSGSSTLVAGQAISPGNYAGQAVLIGPNGLPIQQPQSVAQSTASNNGGSTGQLGWRGRELGSSGRY